MSNTSIIKNLISNFVFTNGIPEMNSLDDKLVQELASKYKNGVDEKTIFSYITGKCFKCILGLPSHLYSGSRKMAEVTKLNLEEITNEIDKFLNTLPLSYDFLFLLPESPIKLTAKLAWNIEIFTIDEAWINKYFPDNSRDEYLTTLIKRKHTNIFKPGDIILKISGSGYIGEFGDVINLNITDPLYIYKCVLGIYLAMKILIITSDPSHFSNQIFNCFAFQDTDEIKQFNKSQEDNILLNKLKFNLTKQNISYLEEINNGIMILLKKLTRSKKTLARAQEQQASILSASYWLYEASKSEQIHTKAVFLTTAFDALSPLKGETDTKENKAVLISNQIAKDSLQANSIEKIIEDLYRFRNRIVHGQERISVITGKYSSEKVSTLYPVKIAEYYLNLYFANRFHFILSGLKKMEGILNKV